MRITVSARLLLVVAIALLAVNLVTLFLVNGARPATAQSVARQCIGVSVAACYDPKDHCTRQAACRGWSDGTVEFTWADEINKPWKPWQALGQ